MSARRGARVAAYAVVGVFLAAILAALLVGIVMTFIKEPLVGLVVWVGGPAFLALFFWAVATLDPRPRGPSR